MRNERSEVDFDFRSLIAPRVFWRLALCVCIWRPAAVGCAPCPCSQSRSLGSSSPFLQSLVYSLSFSSFASPAQKNIFRDVAILHLVSVISRELLWASCYMPIIHGQSQKPSSRKLFVFISTSHKFHGSTAASRENCYSFSNAALN